MLTKQSAEKKSADLRSFARYGDERQKQVNDSIFLKSYPEYTQRIPFHLKPETDVRPTKVG